MDLGKFALDTLTNLNETYTRGLMQKECKWCAREGELFMYNKCPVCFTRDKKKLLNKFVVYNSYMEEIAEKCTFDSITEAKEYIVEHELPRDTFIVLELKRV